MKRLALAVMIVVMVPAAFAFDTTRRPVRIGVLHAPDAYDERVSALVNRLLREELRKRGFVAMGGTPEELAKWTAVQAPLWGPVLQAAGVKPE